MNEFYAEIRLVHIAAVIASGSLFFVRGLALVGGQNWGMAVPLRWLAYTIDTVLLTTALMLITIIQQYPFVQAWLTVKVLLLVVYIGLGMAAFWSGRKRGVRILCWLAALAVYLFIVSVARAHDPLGIFRLASP
ncbi:MAG: SirB2 family protein [Geminicoccaceae bacterium]